MLTALSRGAAGGAGATFRAAMFGLLAGGAGGAGLAFAAAAVAAPFVAGVEVGLAMGGAGGGAGLGAGTACSSRYASGAQPWTEVVVFKQSHHPELISHRGAKHETTLTIPLFRHNLNNFSGMDGQFVGLGAGKII